MNVETTTAATNVHHFASRFRLAKKESVKNRQSDRHDKPLVGKVTAFCFLDKRIDDTKTEPLKFKQKI